MTSEPSWTFSELREALERFEREGRSAGLSENTVRTYVDRSGIFLRLLSGDYQFRGPQG